MKFQPKRFVVEVKRGTNRAAFASPDPSSDRFSSAEAMLFGGTPKVVERAPQSGSVEGEVPNRRILRSLVEPPEPVVEEPPAPARRGRKPGSKNKPKVQQAASPDLAAERPRRGRKPGSKNKPKMPAVAVEVPADGLPGMDDALWGSGFADGAAAWQDAPPPQDAAAAGAEPPRPADAGEPDLKRARLRDRSSILRRYVLDIEPRPGSPGRFRARRRARAGA